MLNYLIKLNKMHRTSSMSPDKKDLINIFKNKPKPITYVKGDCFILAEISEDTLIIPNGGHDYTSHHNHYQPGHSDKMSTKYHSNHINASNILIKYIFRPDLRKRPPSQYKWKHGKENKYS
jgi:hypothetical protein